MMPDDITNAASHEALALAVSAWCEDNDIPLTTDGGRSMTYDELIAWTDDTRARIVFELAARRSDELTVRR